MRVFKFLLIEFRHLKDKYQKFSILFFWNWVLYSNPGTRENLSYREFRVRKFHSFDLYMLCYVDNNGGTKYKYGGAKMGKLQFEVTSKQIDMSNF